MMSIRIHDDGRKLLLRRSLTALLGLFCLTTQIGAASSEEWPSRNVTIIVPFPAGGNTDTMARLLAQKLTEKFGRTFVVDNRQGASGAIGTTAVTRSTPDGYTLLFGAFQQVSVIPFIDKVNYDPQTDLAYVSIFGEGPFVLATNESVPAKNLTDFVAYAKQNAGKLTYASGGYFSGTHLVPALFFSKVGISLNHVPYRGGGPAVADFLGNHVQAYFGNASELTPYDKDPRVTILATSSAKRMPQLPDTPTISETIPGFAFASWNGLMAPAKTPKAVLDALEKASIEASRDPKIIQTLSNLGITPIGSTSAEFRARIETERPLLTDAIAAAKASAP